jgi:hypothetical protein
MCGMCDMLHPILPFLSPCHFAREGVYDAAHPAHPEACRRVCGILHSTKARSEPLTLAKLRRRRCREVQTIELWTPPDVWSDLSPFKLDEILAQIDRGLDDGSRFSAEKRAAWRVIVRPAPEKTATEVTSDSCPRRLRRPIHSRGCLAAISAPF